MCINGRSPARVITVLNKLKITVSPQHLRKIYINNKMEQFVICPFDRSHRLLESRLKRHIFNCHREAWERERCLREAASRASHTPPSPPPRAPPPPPIIECPDNWDNEISQTYVPSMSRELLLDRTAINNYKSVFRRK
ncbi:uncharacterized protein LOC135146086 [Zophobas morio]